MIVASHNPVQTEIDTMAVASVNPEPIQAYMVAYRDIVYMIVHWMTKTGAVEAVLQE